MPIDLPIQCDCGKLRGSARGLSPDQGNHLVCHCDDCQSFAYFLGKADALLDVHGGTEIFQTSPARIAFDGGAEHLACLRLRPGGLLRWYASCCQTPIANTMANARMPFVGLILACTDPAQRDAATGPIAWRIQGRFAKGDRSTLDASDKAPLPLVLRLLGMIVRYGLRGDGKRSPFFDPATHQPTRVPQVLSAEALQAVEGARDTHVLTGAS